GHGAAQVLVFPDDNLEHVAGADPVIIASLCSRGLRAWLGGGLVVGVLVGSLDPLREGRSGALALSEVGAQALDLSLEPLASPGRFLGGPNLGNLLGGHRRGIGRRPGRAIRVLNGDWGRNVRAVESSRTAAEPENCPKRHAQRAAS